MQLNLDVVTPEPRTWSTLLAFMLIKTVSFGSLMCHRKTPKISKKS